MSFKIHPRVESLLRLLGKDALLIPCTYGQKATTFKWSDATIELMSDPKHLAKLRNGNIGVVLGARSGGLCSIDIDSDELIEPFLRENERLRGALRTKGHRGCNIWVRVEGNCPGLKPLAWPDGRKFGEWRGEGAYTVVSGRHPCGRDYQILVDQPPVSLRFEEIKWPDGLPVAWGAQSDIQYQSSTVVQEQSSPAVEPLSNRAVDVIGENEKEVLIEVAKGFLPTDESQNNGLLFNLARRLRDIEKRWGRKLAVGEECFVFDEWHSRNQHLRHTREDYWIEFLQARESARFGLDENPVAMAWEAAKKEPLPPDAERIEDANGKLLLALCYQLQRLRGKDEFYLSSHSAAEVMGVPAMWAWRRLGYFCKHLKVLESLDRGSLKGRMAARFRYVGVNPASTITSDDRQSSGKTSA